MPIGHSHLRITNRKAKNKTPDSVELFSQYSRVKDQIGVINHENYKQFFGAEAADKFASDMTNHDIDKYSEVDPLIDYC